MEGRFSLIVTRFWIYSVTFIAMCVVLTNMFSISKRSFVLSELNSGGSITPRNVRGVKVEFKRTLDIHVLA